MIKLPINYLEIEEIYSNSVGKGMRTIAVASANPEEGCSTLAYAICKRSQADKKRTLLVEMNMLHPELSDIAGHINADWYPDPKSADRCIIHTDESHFDILPAPAETDALRFRNQAHMHKLVEHWLEKYDVIVFDPSPINARNRHNIPAEAVCALADGTILMIMAGETGQTQFKAALDRLVHNDVSLIGVVYNDFKNPRLADEICRETHRLDNWLPNLMSRLRKHIKRSPFFNIDI